jgi:hypothetical protein
MLVLSGLLAGCASGLLAAGATPALVLVLPLPLLPFLLWVRPRAGLMIVLAASVLVEQFGYQVGDRPGALTSQVPFFRTLTPGSLVTALDVLLVLTLTIWVMRSVRSGTPLFHRSPLASRLLLLCGLMLTYTALGLSRGGTLKPALWEIKPFLYLIVLFLLSASLLTTERAVRAVLWTFVLGSGIKAVYGLLIFLSVRHVHPRPEAVLGHEESFFFSLAILLTAGLWAFRVPGRLRLVASWLAPLYLLAAMANSRRVVWAILIFGALVLTCLAYVRQPQRRKGLRRGIAVVLAVSAVYLPLSWNGTGATAQPARAIRSLVAPDARDASSDQYRLLEDANLAVNIRATRSTGTGFGIPIQYAVKLPDLTGFASMLAYVPHNGVLWIWMRLGIVGQLLFWLVVAEALIAAGRLTASRDPETALLGAVVACALVAWVIMGQKDLGFFWLRINCAMGILLGLMVARIRHIGAGQSRVPAPVLEPRPGMVAVQHRSEPVLSGSR